MPETVNGFTVGDVYVVTRPMKAVTWGERTSLVLEMRLKKDSPKPTAIHDIAPGTEILVTAIRRHNTITHGMETWPEGIIRNGPNEGMQVALGNPGLANHVEREAK